MSVSFDTSLSRRSLLSLSAMAAASALAVCVSTAGTGRMVGRQSTPLQDPIGPVHIAPAPTDSELAVMYGPIEDGGFLIPAVPYKQIDPRYYRQQVLDPTGEATALPGRATASFSGVRNGRVGSRRTRWSPASRNWPNIRSRMAAWSRA
jgi:lipoprotein-anchoring transpeptidase ErfK/SrfK